MIELREELHSIGFKCSDTALEKLAQYKDEVLDRLPNGKFQGFQFSCNADKQQIAGPLKDGGVITSLDQVILLDPSPHAEWQGMDNVPMSEYLYAVGQPKHFDFLMESYTTFPWQKSNQEYKDNESTAKAIKDIFVKIASNISSALISGMDKPLLEATLARTISPVPETATDYDSGLQNRSILLVSDYDEERQQADGIGVVKVEYRLTIKDYKDKKRYGSKPSSAAVRIRAKIPELRQAPLGELANKISS